MNLVKKCLLLVAISCVFGCNGPEPQPNLEDIQAQIDEQISAHEKALLEKQNSKEFRVGFRIKGLAQSKVLKTHTYNRFTRTSGLEVLGEEVQIVELIDQDIVNSPVSFVLCDTSIEPNANLCHRTLLGSDKLSPMQFVYYPMLNLSGKVDNIYNLYAVARTTEGEIWYTQESPEKNAFILPFKAYEIVEPKLEMDVTRVDRSGLHFYQMPDSFEFEVNNVMPNKAFYPSEPPSFPVIIYDNNYNEMFSVETRLPSAEGGKVLVKLTEKQRRRLVPGRYVVRVDMPYTIPSLLLGGLGEPNRRVAVGNGFLFDLHVWNDVEIEVFSPSLRYQKLSENHIDLEQMALERRSFYPIDEGILIDVRKDRLIFESKPKLKSLELYGVDTKQIQGLAMRLLRQVIPVDEHKYYLLDNATVSINSVRPEMNGYDFSELEVTELGDLDSATGIVTITANLNVTYSTPIRDEYKLKKRQYNLYEKISRKIPVTIKVTFDSTPVD